MAGLLTAWNPGPCHLWTAQSEGVGLLLVPQKLMNGP